MYTRYHSFSDVAGFRKELLDDTLRETRDGVTDIIPAKIHVGAVYNVEPKMHAREKEFVPMAKELVFDIDANDYDDIRFCACKGTPAVCTICWGLMENAMQVVDSCLRKDFGFKEIIWVFSGRRGVHGWVCDEKARNLTAEARSAVASFIHVPGVPPNGLAYFKKLHPSLKRAYEDVLLPYMENQAKEHNILDNDKGAETFLKALDTFKSGSSKLLREVWEKDMMGTSESKWLQFKSWCEAKSMGDDRRALMRAVVFHFAYPRLDIQVSKQWNHLLKAPMTIHPSTGMICVPITAKPIDKRTGFNPTTVVRIHEVLQEIEHLLAKGEADEASAVRKTSLAPSWHILETFVASLPKSRRKQDSVQW